MAVRIQFRRGTAAEWASANPTLAAGELGYEADTGAFKIGDGSSAWSALPYGAVSEAYVNDAVSSVVGLSPETLNTLEELATAIGNDPDFVNTLSSSISTAEANALAYANSVSAASQTAAQNYADNAIADLVASAPTTLDTLNELAAALGNDANFATTVSTSIGEKLAFVADTTANYEASSSATEVNTIYIATNAPGYVKIGDGVSTWSALTYVGGSLATEIVNSHADVTTNVHGITDTANLAYQADVTQVSTELSALSNTVANVSTVADSAVADAASVSQALDAHGLDTLNVHGIANTADLVVTSDLTTLNTQLSSDISNVQSYADAHVTDTTNVHGISDTANLVYVDALGGATSTEIGYLTGLADNVQTILDTKAPSYSPNFSGTVVLPTDTSIGNVSAAALATLENVSSDIQSQLMSKIDNTLAQTTFAHLSGATFTGPVVIDMTGSFEITSAFGTVDGNALSHVANVTSDIQSQLNSKTTISEVATYYAPKDMPIFTTSATLPADTSIGDVTSTQIGYLANASSNIQDQLDAKASLSGATFSGSVVVTGDLTVSGNTVTVGTQDLVVNDPMIYIGDDNQTNAVDLGLVGSFNDGTYQHTGLVRDAATDKWRLFSGVVAEPTTVIDWANATPDTLEVGTLEPTVGITFADGTTQTSAGVNSLTTFTEKTSNYTLDTLDHKDNVVEMNYPLGTIFTIPTDAALAWPVGASMDIIQTGTGQVTISPDTGVTLNYTPGNKLRTQWSSCTIMKRAANSWILYGDLTA